MNRLTRTALAALLGLLLVVALLAFGSMLGGGLAGLLSRVRPGKPPDATPPAVGEPRSGRELVLHGNVSAIGTEEVKAPSSGTVGALLTTEDQPVTEGQALIQLKCPDLVKELQAARKRLEQAKAKTAQARNDPEIKRLQKVEQALVKTLESLETAELRLRSYRQQHSAAAEALKFRERAEENARRAQRLYLAAKAAFEKARANTRPIGGADPPALVRARLQMEDAKKVLDLSQSQLADARAATDRYPSEVLQLQTLQREAQAVAKRRSELAQVRKRLAARREAQQKAIREARQQEAEAAVHTAEEAVERSQVKAPRSGRLVSLKVRPGDTVRAGQVLAEIEASGGSRLVFRGSAADANRVQVGQDATVEPVGGASFAARVSQVERLGSRIKVFLQPLGETVLPAPGTPLVARIRVR